MIRKLFSWVILLVVLAGCMDSAEPDPSKMGYQYYPLEVGDYREYFVTDIRFQFDKGDTTRFLMREVVKSTFVDQTNTLNYRIERFTRPNNTSPWLADSVFLVTKSLTNVTLTKNNTKRVKLVFPVKEGKEWLADAYNDRLVHAEKEVYTYASVHEPFRFDESRLIFRGNALQFDSTLTVMQGEPGDEILWHDDRKEVYAKGLGMVYRLFFRAALCTPNYEDPDKPITCGSRILNGHERHEVLIANGRL